MSFKFCQINNNHKQHQGLEFYFKKNLSCKRGFSLIELMVVIGIISILSSIAVTSLNSARQKSRDVKRVADIRQFQTSLELYLNDYAEFPLADNPVILGSPAHSCFDEDGFQATCDIGGITYMSLVPSAPKGGTPYAYCSTTSADPLTCAMSTESYMITFTLEAMTGNLSAGPHAITPVGFQ